MTQTGPFPVIAASQQRTSTTTVQDLDWQGFLTAHFPASGRHDLRAITAYSDYKCSRSIDRQSAEGARSKDGEPISSRAAPLEAWEDEGGAAQ